MKSSFHKIIINTFFIITAAIIQSCEKDVYVEPLPENEKNHTRVYVNSNPAGATIYINGKTTGLVTPDTVRWITVGDYQVTLKKEYFWDTTFTISAVNNKITTGYVDYYQSARMLGQISCTSNPAGAKIYLNNIYTGKVTPAMLTKLLPQVHTVKYEYPEYRKDSMDVVVKSSSIVPCGMKLEDTLDVVTYNTTNSKLLVNDYNCLAEDKEGNMWFGTPMDGLLKYDGKKFTRYTSENSPITSNIIRRMTVDKDNNLWIGSSNSIAMYDGVSWTTFICGMVNSLKTCPDNTVIAALDRSGIIKYKDGVVTRITSTTGGLSKNDLSSAYIDNSGVLWAGIYFGGIDQLNGSEWKHLTYKENGLPASFNTSLICDADGDLFGIFTGGFEFSPNINVIARYESGIWSKIFSTTAKISPTNIFVDKKNTLWVGFAEYVFRIINKSTYLNMSNIMHKDIRKFTNSSILLKYTSGNEAIVDSKGNLWIIGNPYGQGIIKIKAGRWNY